MKRTRRRALIEIGMWSDLAILGISLLATSLFVYKYLWQADVLLLKHPLPHLLCALGLGFAWHLSLVHTGAYDSYRVDGFKTQAKALVKGSLLASLWAAAWLLTNRTTRLQISSVLVATLSFWILATLGLLATRLMTRVITVFLRRRGRNLRNVLIVGSNRRAVAIAEDLIKDDRMGYQLVGFVDEHWHSEDAPQFYKDLLIGPVKDILSLLREKVLDEVVITLPMASSYQTTREIIEICHQQGILVRCDSSLFDPPTNASTETASHPRLIIIHERDRDAVQVGAKRVVDILVSSIVLCLLSPLLAIVALAVKFTSPGPVFFIQERLGLGKRRFKILKFRTMIVNAEGLMQGLEHLNETQGPTFKLKKDPRITPIGQFLRKTSIDELPQLINVLTGDMSLVGPRPLPLRDYRGFSEDWHRRRFSVKPGITCLWQVSGRSSVSFDKWMQLDMDYIDKWSIWLDLEILLKTVPAVIRGSGAM